VVYLEAAGADAYEVCRTLHGLRLAGWFEHAHGVLIGRTRGSDQPDLTQHAAVADALGDLGVPVVLDVECGHVPPFLPLVNGALAHVVSTEGRHEVIQTLA
jgi:muramoyltetrapeptide carboxypeptidase